MDVEEAFSEVRQGTRKVSKITHLGDAPPLLHPVKCPIRPGPRRITPLLAGARSSSCPYSRTSWKRCPANFALTAFSEVRTDPRRERWASGRSCRGYSGSLLEPEVYGTARAASPLSHPGTRGIIRAQELLNRARQPSLEIQHLRPLRRDGD